MNNNPTAEADPTNAVLDLTGTDAPPTVKDINTETYEQQSQLEADPPQTIRLVSLFIILLS